MTDRWFRPPVPSLHSLEGRPSRGNSRFGTQGSERQWVSGAKPCLILCTIGLTSLRRLGILLESQRTYPGAFAALLYLSITFPCLNATNGPCALGMNLSIDCVTIFKRLVGEKPPRFTTTWLEPHVVQPQRTGGDNRYFHVRLAFPNARPRRGESCETIVAAPRKPALRVIGGRICKVFSVMVEVINCHSNV